jgi:glycosyltransferase involved in cell wall biosynthesis
MTTPMINGRARGPRVTVLLPNLSGGGAERVMLTVAGGLASEGAEVLLLLGDSTGPLAEQLPANVRVASLGRAHVRQVVPALVRHFRRHRTDCLISTLDHANVAALVARAAAASSIPVAVRVANTMGEVAASGPSRKDRLAMLAARALYPHAQAVIAPSFGVAEDLERVVGARLRRTIRVIPNPVIGSDLAARAAAGPGHPWLEAGQPPVLLTVASLTAKKNHALLLRAAADLRRQAPVRTMILGEGPERGTLEALATRLGLRLGEDVCVPGWVPDPYPYLARCAVYVLASDREGLPGALIQALACGARVVATDCRSGPREILDGGRLGRLVPVGDVAAMTSAIRETLAERAAGTKPADPWSVLSRYTEADAIAAYGALVDELAGPKAAA